MGSKYPVMKPAEIISILEALGFQKVSQKGSHVKYRKEGNPAAMFHDLRPYATFVPMQPFRPM
ncbi:type II toxin-antitoxin system HicA family toxin [Anoxynatronum sibiricum]|uniref:Type II toxin-antitoxin system HicA family toxin n=1 Tax=Anoxynatronum sibiricum TaxID=210623 RepID=A0ABU9VYL6_9CLOT